MISYNIQNWFIKILKVNKVTKETLDSKLGTQTTMFQKGLYVLHVIVLDKETVSGVEKAMCNTPQGC